MKKAQKPITNSDELNKNLSYSSPATWITLSAVIVLLAGFFVWSFVYKIPLKLSGMADVAGGAVTLHVEESKLSSLKEGQKVVISGLEGQIVSFNEGQPVVSSFALEDGEYNYYVVLEEIKPIDFWFRNQR